MNTSAITSPALSATILSRAEELTERSANAPAAADLPQEFEAMLTSLLIKTMRQTGMGDGLFPGDSSDTLGALFDQYLGQHLADSGGIGLAKSLQAYSAHSTPTPADEVARGINVSQLIE